MGFSSQPQDFVHRFAAATVLTLITLAGAAVFSINSSSGASVVRCAGTGCVINNLEVTGTLTNGGSAVGGVSLTNADNRYLRKSGGTLTGATTVDITNGVFGTVGLKVIETLSGAHLHAEGVLTSSGHVITERTLSGALVRSPEVSPRIIMAQVVASGSTVAVGSGKLILVVPRVMSGYILGEAHASVQTAGVTNTSTFRLRNITKNNRQFFGANPLSIDSAEVGSDTAATEPSMAANRDVGAYDRLSFDIMSVSTTAPKGLVITLSFFKP